eukprot:scaffold8843_cov76-Cyclotella_meneghiniana.AAC.3
MLIRVAAAEGSILMSFDELAQATIIKTTINPYLEFRYLRLRKGREGNNRKIYAIAPVEKDKAYVTIS